MKNGRSIILSLLLVLSFLYCMAMAASAEGEDDPLSQDSGKTDISFEESVIPTYAAIVEKTKNIFIDKRNYLV